MAKMKIVLVDDQASYRKTINNVLKLVGDVEIIGEASNGIEYLKLLDTCDPDITFMDIEMPGMDGIEATQKALQKRPSLIIIGLSLYENEDYVTRLISAGARGYLLKLSNNYELLREILKYPKAEIFYSERVKQIIEISPGKAVRTILIVDDFETNTIVVGAALKSAGYNVLKALNAEEGIRHARNENEKIDLIVADFNMPGKNGAEMIAEIKQIGKYNNTPALILSSDNSPEKKQQAKNVGATGWIHKPFQLEKFLKIIDMTLRN